MQTSKKFSYKKDKKITSAVQFLKLFALWKNLNFTLFPNLVSLTKRPKGQACVFYEIGGNNLIKRAYNTLTVQDHHIMN